MISWRKFLQNVINDFKNKGYTFDHIAEKNIIIIANKMIKSYKYINEPMQAIERKLNMIFAKNPNLINSRYRFHNRPLIRK